MGGRLRGDWVGCAVSGHEVVEVDCVNVVVWLLCEWAEYVDMGGIC